MAYNYYPGYYQPQIQPQIAYQQSQTNGGFITVRSEDEARNYPLNPNTSLTFINEREPYFYVKTSGASQFERPKFEKYILTKVEENETQTQTTTKEEYATKSDISALWAEIEKLKNKEIDTNEQSSV